MIDVRGLRLIVGVVLASAGALVAQGKVWVVDDGGGAGVDFTQVSDAVQAAASGDTILVEAGVYLPNFTIGGKSIVIIAETGALISCGAITVQNVPAGGAVVLRGLGSPSLRILDSTGTVWVEGHTVWGGIPACEVKNCAKAVFVRCSFNGGLGGEGMLVTDSNAHLYETFAVGGNGYFDGVSLPSFVFPGVGLRCVRGLLFTGGGSIRGGVGASGGGSPTTCSGCSGGFPGATGLVYQGPGSYYRRQTVIHGGDGGPGGFNWTPTPIFPPCIFPPPLCPPCTATSSCPSGGAGADYVLDMSVAYTLFPGSVRSFSVNSPVREGQNVTLHYAGVTGDAVFLLFNGSPDPFFLWGAAGTLLPSLSGIAVIFQGILGPSQQLDVTFPAPAQADPTLQALHLFAQANFVPSDVTFNASSGSAFVLLDASL